VADPGLVVWYMRLSKFVSFFKSHTPGKGIGERKALAGGGGCAPPRRRRKFLEIIGFFRAFPVVGLSFLMVPRLWQVIEVTATIGQNMLCLHPAPREG